MGKICNILAGMMSFSIICNKDFGDGHYEWHLDPYFLKPMAVTT